MTTIKDMVAMTRRMAFGSMSEQINLVGSAYTAGGTELTLDMDVTGITPGMVLSSGLNVWYVKGLDAANRLVYVIPGYDNSPQGNAAVGDFVFIKPRVTDGYIFESLNEEILRLSAPGNGLYKIAEWTADVDATWQTYIFPSAADDMIGLLRVRYRMPGTEDVWLDIPEKSYRMQIEAGENRVRILRNIPSGTEVRFIYKAPFSAASSLADDPVADCGLADTMVDIPSLGVLATLLRTTESRRNQVQTQGDSRRAGEVQSGANTAAGSRIEREYRDRVNEEAARLMQRVSIQRSL